jgi:hypothetical protein
MLTVIIVATCRFVDHCLGFCWQNEVTWCRTFHLNRLIIMSCQKEEEGCSHAGKVSLLEMLSPLESCDANQMGGTDLAYIGDAIFELFIRSRCVWPSKRTSDLQDQVVALVRGE